MSRIGMKQPQKIRLQKGDTVIVISGKYKGKTGKITATHPDLGKVTVEGINVVKRHTKPNRTHPQGGIVDQTKPIWTSKVAAYEPSTKKPSKIGYKLTKDGKKVRIFKSSGKEMK